MGEVSLIESIKELPKSNPISGVSKYRDLIDAVKDYLEHHPEQHVVKIKALTGSEADRISKKCKEWLYENEDIKITRRGKEVYFMSGIEDDEED